MKPELIKNSPPKATAETLSNNQNNDQQLMPGRNISMVETSEPRSKEANKQKTLQEQLALLQKQLAEREAKITKHEAEIAEREVNVAKRETEIAKRDENNSLRPNAVLAEEDFQEWMKIEGHRHNHAQQEHVRSRCHRTLYKQSIECHQRYGDINFPNNWNYMSASNVASLFNHTERKVEIRHINFEKL